MLEEGEHGCFFEAHRLISFPHPMFPIYFRLRFTFHLILLDRRHFRIQLFIQGCLQAEFYHFAHSYFSHASFDLFLGGKIHGFVDSAHLFDGFAVVDALFLRAV